MLELARAEAADIVVPQEIDSRWLTELEPLKASMPLVKAVPRDDNFGIGIWSRVPLGNLREIESGPFGVPTLTAECEVAGRKLLIVATHPVPPANAEGAAARDAQLSELAGLVAQSSIPVIVIGDLNVTPWAPAYRRFAQTTGLRNTRQGFGIIPTWPAQFRWFGIPLDHCLASPELAARDIRAAPSIGSDHFPLIVDLIVPAAK